MKKTIEALKKKAQELENEVVDARGIINLANQITVTGKGIEIPDYDKEVIATDYAIGLNLQDIEVLLTSYEEDEIYETDAWNDKIAPALWRVIGSEYENIFGKEWNSADSEEWYDDYESAFDMTVKTDREDKELQATAKIDEYLTDEKKRQELSQAIETIRAYDRYEEYGIAGFHKLARENVTEKYQEEMEGWVERMLKGTEDMDAIKAEMDYQLENAIDALIIDEEEGMEEDILASIEGTRATAEGLLKETQETRNHIKEFYGNLNGCLENLGTIAGAKAIQQARTQEIRKRASQAQDLAEKLLETTTRTMEAIEEIMSTIEG